MSAQWAHWRASLADPASGRGARLIAVSALFLWRPRSLYARHSLDETRVEAVIVSPPDGLTIWTGNRAHYETPVNGSIGAVTTKQKLDYVLPRLYWSHLGDVRNVVSVGCIKDSVLSFQLRRGGARSRSNNLTVIVV